MRRYVKRIISLILCAVLVWTTGEGAQAALFLHEPIPAPSMRFMPQVVRPATDPAYFTEQALVQRLIFPRRAGAHISQGHLYRRFLLRSVQPKTWNSGDLSIIFPAVASTLFAAWLFPHEPTFLVTTAIFHTFLMQAAYIAIRMFFGADLQLNLNQLNCGNLLYIGKSDLEDIADLLEAPIQDLINRGIYSFGFSLMIPVKRRVPKDAQIPGFENNEEIIIWEARVGKVFLWKRQDAVKAAKEQMVKQIKEAMKDAAFKPEVIMVSFHSRLGSVGSNGETVQELEDAAQPGIAPPRGQPDDWELSWVPVKSNMKKMPMEPRYVKAQHLYQLNGDLSGSKGTQENSLKESNQIIRDRFSRWLHYTVSFQKPPVWKRPYVYARELLLGDGKVPRGDSPMEALRFKMYHTERMWYPSIRYAIFTYFLHPGDERDMNPPFEQMREWEIFFEHAFRRWVENKPEVAAQWLKEPKTDEEAQTIVQTKARHAGEFQGYLQKLINPSTNQDRLERRQFLEATERAVTAGMIDGISTYFPDPGERQSFLHNATLAFWRNSLEYATLVEMKGRVEGTQAADYMTPLEPFKRVNTAKGQGLVVAFSADGKGALIGSDRIVFKDVPNTIAHTILKIHSSANESLVARWGADGRLHASLYQGAGNSPVPPDEIKQQRLKESADRRGRDEGPFEPTDSVGMEPGIQRGAMQIPRVHQSGERIRQGLPGTNMTPLEERTRVIIQVRIQRVLLAYLLAHGLAAQEMDDWAWQQADALSRDSWNYDKDESQILGEIRRLVIEQARLHGNRRDAGELSIDFETLKLPYDALYVATGKSYLAALKSARSLERSLGLRIKVIPGNGFLEIANKYRDDAGHILDVDALLHDLEITKHTIIRCMSDSGAETYETNIGTAIDRVTTEEPFGVAGSKNNHMVDQFGSERVETTENPGSKAQDGLAASLSMMQTLQEGDLLVTAAITHRFATGGPDWEHHIFFKAPFTHEQVIHLLFPANQEFVSSVPRILGYTPEGIKLDDASGNNDSAKLKKEGRWLSERRMEAGRFWLLAKAYVITTVIGAMVGFGPIALTLLPHIVHQPGWPLLLLARSMDALIYCSFGFGLLLIKRWIFLKLKWSDTKVLEGFSLPSILWVSPYPWVHETLLDYMRIAQGLAYSMTKMALYSSDLIDVNDKFKAVGNRNTIIFNFRARGDHRATEFNDQSADMAGRHFKTQLSVPLPDWRLTRALAMLFRIRPVSPKVIMVGMHEPPDAANDWGQMARDKDVTVAPLHFPVPPGTTFDQLPYHVAEYYLEQYESFLWILIGARIIATEADKSAKGILGFFRYVAGRFQGGYAVKSTQASSPGAEVLDSVERLEEQRPLRMVAIGRSRHDKRVHPVDPPKAPVVFDPTSEWQFWPGVPWLDTGIREHQHFEQPTRPATSHPGSQDAVNVISVPVVSAPATSTEPQAVAGSGDSALPVQSPPAGVAASTKRPSEAAPVPPAAASDSVPAGPDPQFIATLAAKASRGLPFTDHEQDEIIRQLGYLLDHPGMYKAFRKLLHAPNWLPEIPRENDSPPKELRGYLFHRDDGRPRPLVGIIVQAKNDGAYFRILLRKSLPWWKRWMLYDWLGLFVFQLTGLSLVAGVKWFIGIGVGVGGILAWLKWRSSSISPDRLDSLIKPEGQEGTVTPDEFDNLIRSRNSSNQVSPDQLDKLISSAPESSGGTLTRWAKKVLWVGGILGIVILAGYTLHHFGPSFHQILSQGWTHLSTWWHQEWSSLQAHPVQSHIRTHITVPSVAAPPPPVPSPVLPQVAQIVGEATHTALKHTIGITPRDVKGLGEVVLRLRKSDPVLRQALGGTKNIWRPIGPGQRSPVQILADALKGQHSFRGLSSHLRTGQYDISTLYPAASSASSGVPPVAPSAVSQLSPGLHAIASSAAFLAAGMVLLSSVKRSGRQFLRQGA